MPSFVTGYTWGFGAVMSGQGVSTLGISMGNTPVLAILMRSIGILGRSGSVG